MGHVVQHMGKLNVRTIVFNNFYNTYDVCNSVRFKEFSEHKTKIPSKFNSKALLLLQSGQCHCSGADLHYDS
jgi:hypothetical protein